MPNSSHLEGLACPKCKSEGPLGIACDNVMEVSDKCGIESPLGDHTWDDDSYCECRACGHSGVVKDFFTLRKRFKALLQASDDSYLEYEEKHGDAGSAYIHMVKEDMSVTRSRLLDYLKEHMPEVTQAERGALVHKVDEWCIDMQPGHRFSTTDPAEGCCVGSWALEEVENQHEAERFAEELDCTIEEVRELVQAERAESGGACIGQLYKDDFDTFCTYQATDAVWCAVVPREWINDQLEEIRQEAAEKQAEKEAEQAERDIAHCIKTGHHLTSCGDDGYCDYCGYQD